jgi:integrase
VARAGSGENDAQVVDIPEVYAETDLVPAQGANLELLRADAERAQVYAADAQSKNTQRAYKADWRAFEAWCDARGVLARDAKPAAVAAYATWRADSGYAAKSIERACAGIASRLRLVDPVSWPRGGQPEPVRLALSGIRRRLGTRPLFAKDAATIEIIRQMLPHLGEGLRGARNRAIVLVGFFGGMRRSEIVALDVEDVTITAEGMVALTRFSKTDQEGQGHERGYKHQKDRDVCAPCAVHRWKKLSGIASGALFRAVFGEVVQPKRLGEPVVATIVQRAAAAAGLDPERFGGHSLRSGLVTTAAERGVDLDSIMRQTGHKSVEQVRTYIKHATVLGKTNVTGRLDE